AELAVEVRTAVREHFQRLPKFIVNKLKRARLFTDDILPVEDDESSDGDKQKDKMSFKKGQSIPVTNTRGILTSNTTPFNNADHSFNDYRSIIYESKSKKRSRVKGDEVDSKEFWHKPGVDFFVEWITDPCSHEKLSNPRPIAAQRLIDLYDELANLVNKKYSVHWGRDTVKSKIQYAKKKYDKARTLATLTGAGDTDIETLRSQMILH
ncbi:hypothetical protein BGZ54_001131, partial [Gamsiella multidivaricata]